MVKVVRLTNTIPLTEVEWKVLLALQKAETGLDVMLLGWHASDALSSLRLKGVIDRKYEPVSGVKVEWSP